VVTIEGIGWVRDSGMNSLSLGRSKKLEFVTCQVRQLKDLLGQEVEVFSPF